MTEQEFDLRMDETEETWQYLKGKIERLQELKDNRADVYSGLDYAEMRAIVNWRPGGQTARAGRR